MMREARENTHLLNLILVGCLKYSVASDVVSLPADIFTDAFEQFSVGDAYRLQKCDQVVWAVGSVWTAMILSRSRQWLC